MGCKIVDRAKMEDMKPIDVESLVIGDITLNDDEKQVIKLNQKFAVMLRLNEEEMERDTDIAATKMRYEIRRDKGKKLMEVVDLERIEEEKLAKKVKLDEIENEKEIKESRKERERNDIIEDAQERQIFDPKKKNCLINKVYMPKLCDAKEESEIEIVMEELKSYKTRL